MFLLTYFSFLSCVGDLGGGFVLCRFSRRCSSDASLDVLCLERLCGLRPCSWREHLQLSGIACSAFYVPALLICICCEAMMGSDLLGRVRGTLMKVPFLYLFACLYIFCMCSSLEIQN